jgi:ABC-type siderophore export system fused ATPase/permease subunit
MGRFVIAITHNESYCDRCDRLVHLADGRVLTDEHRAATTTAGSALS